ncbi:G-protein coupled receptor Mth2-like [Hyposmocoma kahamanoa]|uniref:G-protein coupled receptor Mth2-like n=1 Tax=Hyposmocoma kahamanoa TaxID=1477025 RepID=UPI000E6D5E52|nr:G-protein coupled receptor Mth2-like [Hyposmocoma kahamanoa]
MSSFCWMNVMSMDIWWTFRGYAKARPIHRRGEMFKFCMYCQYGYGVPILLTIILTVMDLVDLRHKPWIVVPGIIKMGCFIGDDGKFFYLYVPMLILTMTNWVLFLMTAFNIWRLHRNTAVLDSAAAGTPAAHRTQRYRLLVYLKLSIIMGINWVLEVISSNYPNFKGWYITDAYNLLMGFFIFLIFVCKREILRKLIKRFKSDNEFQWRRNLWHSKSNKSASSAVSHTTDSEISQDTPLQVCIHPKGPAPNYISH